MKSLSRARAAGIEADGFRIEAMIPETNGETFKRARIGLSRIDYTYAVDDTTSCIRLISGVVIPVCLSLDALDERFENHDTTKDIIDLTDVTGDAAAAEAARKIKLATTFNEAVEKSTDGSFTIRAFVRQHPYNDEHWLAEINSAHIESYEANSDRPRSETRIQLQQKFHAANNGYKNIYIAIAPNAFRQLMLQTAEKGAALLDLYEATKPSASGRMQQRKLTL